MNRQGGRNTGGATSPRPDFEIALLEPRRLLSAVAPFAHEAVRGLWVPPVQESLVQSVPFAAESGPVFSLDSLPVLNSKPDAFAQLVLDFDGDEAREDWGGEDVTETPAYDIDGDPTAFSQQELDNIYLIWSRVSEKFSPFNINVTTVDTGNLNNQETLKVVIGGNASWLGEIGPLIGGVALLGSFYNELPNVAYVFSENLDPNNVKTIAEVIAHEAGHAFGLEHQSRYNAAGQKIEEYHSGDAMKAPIMGMSDMAQRGLWWLGTSSLGPSIIQDDLAVLSGSLNGFGYRSDDHGNTIATATFLDTSDGTFSASGLIERNGDVDMFSFIANTGPFTITLSVAEHGPMLDGKLVLLDSNGNVVMTRDTPSLGETMSGTLDVGVYYLAVSGTADYGDLGQYILAGEVSTAKFLQFSQPTFTVREDGGFATITVTRSDLEADTVSVSFATSDGTAVAGQHYTAVSGTLVFAGGETSKTIQIPIIDNDIVDGNKTVFIALSNPTGEAELGPINQAVLTILDNEAFVRFLSPTYTIRENHGVLRVTVVRSGSSLDGLSVNYATSDGTATAGEDYLVASGTLAFAQGEMSKDVFISILQDDLLEDTETFFITLSNPAGGAILADPSVATVNILDHDEIPPQIVEMQLVPHNRRIGGIVLKFNEPMDLNYVLNPASYILRRPNGDGRLGTGLANNIRIRSISYDPETWSVTITPQRPLAPNRFFILGVNGDIGPTDRSHNRLDGNGDGTAGGTYWRLFGRGNQLRYLDRNGARVVLNLRQGGVMEMIRSFDGNGETLRLLDSDPERSILVGRVLRKSGPTKIDLLSGLNTVENRLADGLFTIGAQV